MAKLEEQIQISMVEARKSASELQTVTRKHDAVLRDLKEENVRLKEKNEQIQSQLHEVRNWSIEYGMNLMLNSIDVTSYFFLKKDNIAV